jgi:hypothetical protein
VNDYSSFFGLIGANAVAVGLGVAWYRRIGSGWLSDGSGSAYPDLDSINSSDTAKEVDYPVVKARLDAAKRLLKEGSLDTAAPFVFDVYTYEAESGQNLEHATFDMVMETTLLAEPHGVRLLAINVNEQSGVMVLDTFAKMQGKLPSEVMLALGGGAWD